MLLEAEVSLLPGFVQGFFDDWMDSLVINEKNPIRVLRLIMPVSAKHCILFCLPLAVACNPANTSKEGVMVNKVVVPAEPNEYFNPDRRLIFTFPDDYDDSILRLDQVKNRIKFGFDFSDSVFKSTQFDKSPDFAVALLYLAKRDAIKGLLGLGESSDGAYFSLFRESEKRFHTLRVYTNREVETLDFPEEKLFVEPSENPKFFIYCRPSGNDYPTYCKMTVQEVLPASESSNCTLLAEVTFDEKNLERWGEILGSLEKIVSDHGKLVRNPTGIGEDE